jgi:predicted phosphate transport protein (TIGR00153 family)
MRLLPKAEIFLEWFQEQAEILVKSSELLLEGVRSGAGGYGDTPARIESLERTADGVVHKVANELGRTFITPYDPEDIHRLSSSLDDIVDALEEAAHRIGAYRLSPIPQIIVQLAEILDEAAHAVKRAVAALADCDQAVVARKCLEIDRLESEADILMREAIAALFARANDAITLMKLKEIYELMEQAIDRCEDVADTLRTLVVKGL